jgi:hypothetical protein
MNPGILAKELDIDFKEHLTKVLKEYKDVFTLSYEDMKCLNLEFYHHKINLLNDAIPVQQCWYRLNPNYAAKVKEEVNKLLKISFIQPIKCVTCLSSIMVVLKKNGKLRVCIDYQKLNTTITDSLPNLLWMGYSIQ